MSEDAKDLTKVHPLRRRKHRRGKRGGKKHREQQVSKAKVEQGKVQSLRSILERLAQRKTA